MIVVMMTKSIFAACTAPRDISLHIIDSFKPFHDAYVVLGVEHENIVVTRDVICTNFAFDCGDKTDYEVLEEFVAVVSKIRDRAYEGWKDVEVNKKCFASKSNESLVKQSISNCFN